MGELDNFKLKEPWITVIAIISIILAIFIFNLFFKEKVDNKNNQIQPTFTKDDLEKLKNNEAEIQKKSDYFFNLYKSLNKIEIYKGGLVTPVSLIQSCEDKAKIPGRCNEEIASITRILNTTGNITDGYLYIKAGVSRGGNALGNLTEDDSIYFFIDDAKNYGGQLLRSSAKWSKINSDSIELLFDLKEIPFIHLPYNDLAEPDKVVNVIDVLKQSDKHFIASFVSTLGYGKIFELKIGYSGGNIKMLSN